MEIFRTNPVSLPYLLSSIHERRLALPDFQRDFVWDAPATEELVESIARSFPAGSLLFMPWRARAFTPRAIQGAPPLDGMTPHELILDGQQRLSSLYQACYGVGDYRYFVDLKPLLEGDEIEEAVFYRHRNRSGPYATLDQQAERLVLPLGVLFGRSGGFHAWRDDILDRRPEQGDDRADLRDRIRAVYERRLKTIEDYRFPVVVLDDATTLEAVCSIFETLNRTGIRLSVFDLLAARFYAQGLDLRRLWDETVKGIGVLAEFDIDRYHVLQAIALRTRGSVKRGDVLDLSVAEVEAQWDVVLQGYRAALEMVRDECGVKAAKWLPYGYLLVAMSAVWREAIGGGGAAAGANRGRLKRWFWCSSFAQTYDRAANSQATRDFHELRRWTNGGDEPETVAQFAFDATRLREITPKQQSIYRALMALVLCHGAADFHTARELTPASIAAERIDDHHIFPRAHLNPPADAPRQPLQLVDCILNRTLIDARTNQRIGKRSPRDYLAEVRAELDALDATGAAFQQLLASHLLPLGPGSPLLEDAFEPFLDARSELLLAQLRAVTGGTGAPVAPADPSSG
jgi:hypothetical protein